MGDAGVLGLGAAVLWRAAAPFHFLKTDKQIMKYKTTSSLLLAILALAVHANAENLLKNGNAESGSGEGWSPAPTLSAEAHGGSNSFLIANAGREILSDPIEVHPGAVYVLTGFFKSAGKSALHFGLQPYDAQGRRINSININRLPDTATVLTADAKEGDTTLLIANGQAWKADPKWAAAAFNIDASGSLTDLPNFNISGLGITEVRKAGDHWEVVLASPLPAPYPKGTKVAEHLAAGGNMYIDAMPKNIGSEWVKISGPIRGTDTGLSGNKFWLGTTSVKVVVIANANEAGDAMFFDDIELEKVSDQ